MMPNVKIIAILLVGLFMSCFTSKPYAQDYASLSNGQTVYVPAYSHIYVGGKKRPFSLAITLSIRNIDLNSDITITDAKYYNSEGKLIESFVDNPTSISPQKAVRFVIPEQDKGGGSSANFIVKWDAATTVNPPIIESIMVGTRAGQGVSFTSRGRAIIK